MFGKNITVEMLAQKGYEVKFRRKKGSASPKGQEASVGEAAELQTLTAPLPNTSATEPVSQPASQAVTAPADTQSLEKVLRYYGICAKEGCGMILRIFKKLQSFKNCSHYK